MNDQSLTFGQKAVWLSFNPSGAQINPKYIELIERIKEKHPELRELVEELRKWCLIINEFWEYYIFWKMCKNWSSFDTVNWDGNIDRFCYPLVKNKIIWQLDLYILSKAISESDYILNWLILNRKSDDISATLPHCNISEYPDELLDTLYNLI